MHRLRASIVFAPHFSVEVFLDPITLSGLVTVAHAGNFPAKLA
jgi:hypothetical protein